MAGILPQVIVDGAIAQVAAAATGEGVVASYGIKEYLKNKDTICGQFN
jgi:hypothetical protein